MNSDQQLKAVQPLIDSVAELIRHGQHPEASPRLKPESTAQDKGMAGRIAPRANVEQGGGVPEKARTALIEAAEWFEEEASFCRHDTATWQKLQRFATACREANEQ